MKRIWLGTVAFAAFVVGPAVAADLPVRAPAYRVAPPPAVMTWTGFYVGGHFGYGWEHHSILNVGTVNGASFPAGTTHSVDADGLIAGGQLGYDWQFYPNWLLGVAGDFSGTDINRHYDQVSVTVANRVSHSFTETQWLATVTGRIGYIAANNWLLYFKGGGAWKHSEGFSDTVNTVTGAVLTSTTNSQTRSGWTVGAGSEYKITQNWSTFVEYDYMDFGTATQTNLVTFGTTAPVVTGASTLRDQTQHLHLVKAGVNYRF